MSEDRSTTAADPTLARDDGDDATAALDPSTLCGLRALGAQTGAPELLAELVGMFTSAAPGRFAALHAALEAGDLARGLSVAHALKGSAGQLGALELAAVAERLELACAAGEVAAARGLMREVDASLAAATRAFQALLRDR